MQVYYEDFECFEDVESEFQVSLAHKENFRVLFAIYTYEYYNGDAFVLFEENGELFEVNGGHCSCYGLEGQWEPEKTSEEALLHRLKHGTFYAGVQPEALTAYLEERKKSC